MAIVGYPQIVRNLALLTARQQITQRQVASSSAPSELPSSVVLASPAASIPRRGRCLLIVVAQLALGFFVSTTISAAVAEADNVSLAIQASGVWMNRYRRYASPVKPWPGALW